MEALHRGAAAPLICEHQASSTTWSIKVTSSALHFTAGAWLRSHYWGGNQWKGASLQVGTGHKGDANCVRSGKEKGNCAPNILQAPKNQGQLSRCQEREGNMPPAPRHHAHTHIYHTVHVSRCKYTPQSIHTT